MYRGFSPNLRTGPDQPLRERYICQTHTKTLANSLSVFLPTPSQPCTRSSSSLGLCLLSLKNGGYCGLLCFTCLAGFGAIKYHTCGHRRGCQRQALFRAPHPFLQVLGSRTPPLTAPKRGSNSPMTGPWYSSFASPLSEA